MGDQLWFNLVATLVILTFLSLKIGRNVDVCQKSNAQDAPTDDRKEKS